MVNNFMLDTYCLHIHSSKDVAIGLLSTQLSKMLSDKTGSTYNSSVHMNYHLYGDTDLYRWKQF
jgi:hypothetical protein